MILFNKNYRIAKENLKRTRIGKCLKRIKHYFVKEPKGAEEVEKHIVQSDEEKRKKYEQDIIKYERERKKYKKILFATHEETFTQLLQGKSLCRFGDGEIGWMLGRHKYNAFKQENSELLSQRLRQIIMSDSEDILIGALDVFESIDFLEDWAMPFNISALAEYGKDWMSVLQEDKVYHDSRITRLYGDVKDKAGASRQFDRWKDIFRNRKIVIIEGEYSRFGVGNDLLSDAAKIKRIIAPAENAFAKYDAIYDAARKMDPEALFLIALGPTATVLAFDLAQIGYQAIDIGHLDIEYEWYSRRMPPQSVVPGKYVNESLQSADEYMSLRCFKHSDVRAYRKSICSVVK